jgi:hypothetical protein
MQKEQAAAKGPMTDKCAKTEITALPEETCKPSSSAVTQT